jgi:hypothetical protein
MVVDKKPDLQLYDTIFETWRFQVDSYWQRTSYFAAFETASLVGEWTLLNSYPAHIYTARFTTVLGILLTVLWFLNNLKTHGYVDYWWTALGGIEKDLNVQPDPVARKMNFVSEYKERRKAVKVNAPIKYSYQVQSVPILFLLAWIWLFFLPFMSSQPAHNLNQAEIATADRQSTTQPAINATPAGTVSDAASVNEEASQADQTKITTGEKPKHDLIDHINLLSTAVIAVFTFMMFVVMRRQDRATKIAERAWVVSDIGSLEPTTRNDKVQVICKIRNNGRTPAWITAMGSCGKLVRSESDLPENPPFTDAGPFTPKGSVLSPNAFTETGIPITAQQLQTLVRGEVILYFMGYVKYRDAFNQKHETQYCYQLKPSHDLTSTAPLEFYVGGPDRFNRID